MSKKKTKPELKQDMKHELQDLYDEVAERYKQDFPTMIKEQKEEILEELHEISEEMGKDIPYTLLSNSLTGRNFFNMKSYSSVEMWGGFNVFKELVNEIVTKYDPDFVPTVEQYCRFMGVSKPTYNNYRRDEDEQMRAVIEMIEAYFVDLNLTLAQKGKLKERSTMFRLKTTHSLVEAKKPIETERKDSRSIEEITKQISQAMSNIEKK